MEIKKLEKINENTTIDWGLNGYETDKVIAISTIEIGNTFEFNLREKNQLYKKIWETTSEDIDDLNEIIEQGNSFGAFENGELIGWAICDFREWNNSLFIENILIDEKFRGQNIGKLFIKNINRKARELQCRLVELETQNTNYPAIKFFQNVGFSITGINTKLYKDSIETALYMSFEVLI
ncbi:streptothricin acetyltransferase [Chryseobacterium formosense]|uniref:Streptothricin acetyltransferase n=1 Tax=Chryseobacterium formosense TaxID=236814 RepID=A0A085Z7M0_9FLAO|nr:GNAT family N-acetyltransferase [Chryseobacterium formosense]KFF00434.1 streptothricin acetyltransferase [Chryseobacterium formosense]SFT33863.1 Acetyltransferase (GNAT) family protein [Chryseobacterium formosense]